MRLLESPTLEELELMRARINEGSRSCRRQSLPQIPRTTSLKSLRLLDCYLSHEWASAFLVLPRALQSLESAVTSSRSAEFSEHLLMHDCACVEPLFETLESLTYNNLLPVSRNRRAHHLNKFANVTSLTVSASDLFGDMSVASLPSIWNTWVNLFPPKLEYLHLCVHGLERHGDVFGVAEGIWKVLRRILNFEQKQRVPTWKELILYVFSKNTTLPPGLIELGASSGVEVRLASFDQHASLIERQRLRMLLS